MINCVHIDFQAVLVTVQDAADGGGIGFENVLGDGKSGRVANNDGGDRESIPNMSKSHVSGVFDDVVDNEDADSAVCSGVARLVAEVAVASKHNRNAVVHGVPTA